MKNRIFPYTVIISIICFCFSCKPSGNALNSGKKLYTDFFVGGGGTQYFIKPLEFESKVGTKEEILVDITFRYKDEIKDSATVNFSIVGSKPYKSILKFILKGETISFVSDEVDLMYNERGKDGFISRFSCKLPLSVLTEMVKSGYDWEITISDNSQTNYSYRSSKKTIKSLEKLDESLFILID